MKLFFHNQIHSVVRKQIVLSIEDNDADFVIIEMALKRCMPALTIWRATAGDQAIDFLQKSGTHLAGIPLPDLILLDANMPRRDGYEVLRSLGSSESTRKIPVVMFTSATTVSERRKAFALGASDFITKSNDLDRVLDELSRACSKHLRPVDSQKEPLSVEVNPIR